MPQIELIETFLDLIETSSFNRTADRLGVTQSTVSGRIRVLETLLGGKKLFTRSRAGTATTIAGNRFADHARTLRHEWNEARRNVASTGNFSQQMRIGIQYDLAADHIGDWVSRLRAALPKAAFYVEVDYSNQMCADLLSGNLDMAVLFTPRNSPDLHFEMVGELRYRMVSTSAGNLRDVTAENYIRANYSPAFDIAHRQAHPLLPGAAIASGQSEAIGALLLSMGGSAYLPEDFAARLRAEGKCRLVDGAPAIGQPVYFGLHVRRRHANEHKRLRAIVRQYFVRAR